MIATGFLRLALYLAAVGLACLAVGELARLLP